MTVAPITADQGPMVSNAMVPAMLAFMIARAMRARRRSVFSSKKAADLAALMCVILHWLVVEKDARGGPFEVIVLAGTKRPQERHEIEKAEAEGDGNQEKVWIEQRALEARPGTHVQADRCTRQRLAALTRSLLRRITRRTIERSAPLQRVLSQALTQKLEKLHEETSLRTRMSATECVAAMILSLPRAEPERANPEADGSDHRLAVAQSEMASYLGLAIETVCRAMKNLKRMGCIQTAGRDTIAILDHASLARLAAPDRAASAAVD